MLPAAIVKQIVEIVRDAGGQQGDGLDLLRLVELRLQRGTLGDRVARLGQRHLLALRAAQRDEIQQDEAEHRRDGDQA